MAFDGATLKIITQKIADECKDAKIEKIYQPQKDQLIIALKGKKGTKKLLISAASSSARIHFTQAASENPAVPPMFCMLLRKKLSSGRLLGVRMTGLERIAFFDFEVLNELADKVVLTLCVEIMGHNSNIILIGSDGRIIDAIKRVGADISSVRFVLPGAKYVLPPAQDKKNLFEISENEVLSDLDSMGETPLDKALLSLYCGLSPIVCREAMHFVSSGKDAVCSRLSDLQKDKLIFFISKLRRAIYDGDSVAVAVYENSRLPRDFSFIEINQYSYTALTRKFESFDELLDVFYSEKDRLERIKQKSGDLLKQVANISDRISRKISNQLCDLEKCKDRDYFKKCGDIIYANLHLLEKGQTFAELCDFYAEDTPKIKISLDPLLTPAENAQKYYTEYRKADTAQKKLTELIALEKDELYYIDSVFDSLVRSSSEAELNAIKEELYAERYIKRRSEKKQIKSAIGYLKYISTSGFVILCGKNNRQNDTLTLKESAKGDLWFHTQKIPGSHTVIVSNGKEIDDKTIEEAAAIAAYNSKARESSKVAVDYTVIKNVKKPSGAKPGMVIYDNYKTIIITPDRETAEKLKSN